MLVPELMSVAPQARLVPLDRIAASCPPFVDDVSWYEECEVQDTLARTPEGWLLLTSDRSEGGLETLFVHLDHREIFTGGFDGDSVDRVRELFAGHSDAAPANVITEVAGAEFSLNEYAPLVGLGGPLTPWLLWLEPVQDLDRPEWVLWLIARDDLTKHELARRPANVTPCDGGGWYCGPDEDECTAAQLRAEGRLCVQPIGIDVVAVHEGSLALMGTRQVAGHGGYPPMHWVVQLSERVARP